MSIAHQGDNERLDGGAGKIDDGELCAAIDACDLSLIESPLDFLLCEHLRQRQLAKMLTLIADGIINRRTVESVILFVENDLARHILDEEISLFPVLRPLCEAEDKIEAILGLLAEDHRADENASDAILEVLREIAAGREADEAGRTALRNFAEHLRHHIALENGVLLPIARARMTDDALALVAQSMRARRNPRRA